MGYTHYLPKQALIKWVFTPDQMNHIRRLYQACLSVLTPWDDDLINLLDVFRYNINMTEHDWPAYIHGYKEHNVTEIFDQYFHEFAVDTVGDPIIFPTQDTPHVSEFIKTNRKLYDLAVVLTLTAVQKVYGLKWASDAGQHWIDIFDNAAGDPSQKLLQEAIEQYAIWELHAHIPVLTIYTLSNIFHSFVQNMKFAGPMPLSGLPDAGVSSSSEEQQVAIDTDPTVTRIGQLTIYGRVNVWDLRHIADEIEKWVLFSPADGSYLWQPSWVYSKI